MDALIAILVVVLILGLLIGGIGSEKPYRCQKCGFTTTSELEAAGHEKMENSHKVVKEQ